jgi:hypothetical protein
MVAGRLEAVLGTMRSVGVTVTEICALELFPAAS